MNDSLLTIKECAAYLHVTERTVYGYLAAETLPVTWLGVRRRVALADATAFLEEVQASGREPGKAAQFGIEPTAKPKHKVESVQDSE